MGFIRRMRFLFGLLAVLLVVLGLFLYLNYTMSHITSQRASLEVDTYAVTGDYAGVIRQQFVSPGDEVDEGDRLFEISSPALTQAIRDDRIDEDSALFDVADNGNMVLLANAPGIVQQINFSSGAYVEANEEIASIATDNPRYVVAYYLLNAPDYARVNRDNPVQVTLPDNSRHEAEVFDINLEQDEQQVFTVVRARLPADGDILPTFTSGTPVETSWDLDNSDWQNTALEFVRSLIEPRTEN